MRASPKINAAVARFIFRYEKRTGRIYWRVTCGGGPRGAGMLAGCATTHSKGYNVVKVFGRRYVAHRLAWLIVKGRWPRRPVDHRNNRPYDNRWRNLRMVSESQNRMNSKRYANNTTGHKGVTRTRSGRYAASIAADGQSHWLGVHGSIKSAGRAYRRAARKYHRGYARFN